MSSGARIVLEDGTKIAGEGFGAPVAAAGEVVFNTGMVGYPETLTDPSYCGQILVMTYPLVGNYGVPGYVEDEHGLPRGFESRRVQVAGLVVSEHSQHYSHHTATCSLHQWLANEGVPALSGVDTRALTKRLRDKGTMLGKLETHDQETGFVDPNVIDLVSRVSVEEVIHYHPHGGGVGSPTVVLLDCGCKTSILRSLLDRGMNVIRMPDNHYFLNLDYDGLLISNGPGDPQMCTTAIRNVEHALAVGKPILGICLGNQILARAVGAQTYKLKFGHRGQNQPCLEMVVGPDGETTPTERCVITSQNHGFAVREDGLPEDWRVWFLNANDRTVEGIRHVTRPFCGVQFHPEANPGPVDTASVFDEFVEQIRLRI